MRNMFVYFKIISWYHNSGIRKRDYRVVLKFRLVPEYYCMHAGEREVGLNLLRFLILSLVAPQLIYSWVYLFHLIILHSFFAVKLGYLSPIRFIPSNRSIWLSWWTRSILQTWTSNVVGNASWWGNVGCSEAASYRWRKEVALWGSLDEYVLILIAGSGGLKVHLK